MADRILELPYRDIIVDPANPTGWIVLHEAKAVSTGQNADTLSVEVPVAATDTIAVWENKRRDAYRLAAGKATAPVILLPFKVAT